MRNVIVLWMFLFWSQAEAGQYCWNEQIKLVILNGQGNVYFTTSKSCPNWCLINPAWSQDQIDRAYSMLITAKTADRPVSFYWAAHTTSCEGPVETYSKPGTLLY